MITGTSTTRRKESAPRLRELSLPPLLFLPSSSGKRRQRSSVIDEALRTLHQLLTLLLLVDMAGFVGGPIDASGAAIYPEVPPASGFASVLRTQSIESQLEDYYCPLKCCQYSVGHSLRVGGHSLVSEDAALVSEDHLSYRRTQLSCCRAGMSLSCSVHGCFGLKVAWTVSVPPKLCKDVCMVSNPLGEEVSQQAQPNRSPLVWCCGRVVCESQGVLDNPRL